MGGDPGLSWLAIAGGRVVACVEEVDGQETAGFLCEHAGDPDVTELVRMPHAAVFRFYRLPWPGRDAALAIIAQETPHADR